MFFTYNVLTVIFVGKGCKHKISLKRVWVSFIGVNCNSNSNNN